MQTCSVESETESVELAQANEAASMACHCQPLAGQDRTGQATRLLF